MQFVALLFAIAMMCSYRCSLVLLCPHRVHPLTGTHGVPRLQFVGVRFFIVCATVCNRVGYANCCVEYDSGA